MLLLLLQSKTHLHNKDSCTNNSWIVHVSMSLGVHVSQNVRDACGIQPIESQIKMKRKKKLFPAKKQTNKKVQISARCSLLYERYAKYMAHMPNE